MNCLAQRKKFKTKHAAWSDPNESKTSQDEHIHIDEDNEERQHGSSSESDDNEELIVGDVRSKKKNLNSDKLLFRHVVDINSERSFNGSVRGVQLHPRSKVALITLASGQSDLFEIDGERNRHLQNIAVPFAKGIRSKFSQDGNSIVVSSENFRGNFFTYDMIGGDIKKHVVKVGKDRKEFSDFVLSDKYMACRKDGSSEILVLSSQTYENLFTLKLSEPAKEIIFTTKGEIFVAGENAKIYNWDIRKTTLCKHKFQDEGSVNTHSFALSEESKSLSVGSSCGIVNTYDLDVCCKSKYPTPTKTYTNLKEIVDLLRYNHSGELLLMGSKQQFEGFRLAHTLSGTVYRNFPKSGKRYGKLYDAQFSPHDGFLALGCSSGRAHLCRLPYYKSY